MALAGGEDLPVKVAISLTLSLTLTLGHASAALAGKFSETLGRKRKTMLERAHAAVALAGEFSKELGRNRAIAGEVTTKTLVIFSHRPSTDYDWSAWQGSRYQRLGGGLDGVSRNMLASGTC